jgi:hypothetical protein
MTSNQQLWMQVPDLELAENRQKAAIRIITSNFAAQVTKQ